MKEALALKKDGEEEETSCQEGIEKALTNRARNIKNQFSCRSTIRRDLSKVGSCKDLAGPISIE